ncbi:MAG: histidine phosphatase family protein [Bosea sp. (in: a-proteobacteria)]
MLTPPPFTLYLIRHGETDWNAEGRLQGGKDIPLNDYGRVQAEEVGRRLRGLDPNVEDLDYLCSPLGRTRETMEIMRTAMGLHPPYYKLDERLREITFGTWEGLTWREVRKQDAARARAREDNKWHFVPPSGESYEMLLARVMPVFLSLRRNTVVVSHGGVMRAALAGFGLERPGTAENLDIHQGRVIAVANGAYSWH